MIEELEKGRIGITVFEKPKESVVSINGASCEYISSAEFSYLQDMAKIISQALGKKCLLQNFKISGVVKSTNQEYFQD